MDLTKFSWKSVEIGNFLFLSDLKVNYDNIVVNKEDLCLFCSKGANIRCDSDSIRGREFPRDGEFPVSRE